MVMLSFFIQSHPIPSYPIPSLTHSIPSYPDSFIRKKRRHNRHSNINTLNGYLVLAILRLRVINGYLVLAILRLRVRFRLLVCREHFDPFWDAMASFIGCYEVAQETGLKFLSQNSPIVQLDAAPTQFHVQPQTGHSVVKSDISHIFT